MIVKSNALYTLEFLMIKIPIREAEAFSCLKSNALFILEFLRTAYHKKYFYD